MAYVSSRHEEFGGEPICLAFSLRSDDPMHDQMPEFMAEAQAETVARKAGIDE